MKNRRITIFFTAALVLAGTPRVWQEAGNLLNFIQRKAQLKFFGMVMEPRERTSAETELVASLQPSEIQPALLETSCPIERANSQEHQASANSPAEPRLDSRKVKSQRRPAEVKGSHTGSTLAANTRQAEFARSLRSTKKIAPNERPVWIAENIPVVVPKHEAAKALPNPQGFKGEPLGVVYLPAVSSAAMALSEKENVVQFKMLKKILDENKITRQRSRPSGARGFAPLPSS